MNISFKGIENFKILKHMQEKEGPLMLSDGETVPAQETIQTIKVKLKLTDDGEKDLTQYKLAIVSGIPFATIKSIMQKRTKGITLKTIILLSNGLGISPSEFINDKSFFAENLDLD